MAWTPALRLRRLRTARPADHPSPVAVRYAAGCVVIELRAELGPAAEASLGRLLHGVIRPGGTPVLLDLRHAGELGPGGLSALLLARVLVDRHGLALAVVRKDGVPELYYAGARLTPPPRLTRDGGCPAPDLLLRSGDEAGT
ncbi:hypothetical protein [Streptomyces sp. NPDC016845]|uniref:hypothetical protein n=1 Tax=Streptomyces sp. NPDC016845 TaxID=3364972 RepID=UPI00379D13F5